MVGMSGSQPFRHFPCIVGLSGLLQTWHRQLSRLNSARARFQYGRRLDKAT